MEDNHKRFAVFCTADIPIATLESFLVGSEKCHLDLSTWDDEVDLSDELVLMTSKDLSTIHHGMSSPVQPFTSPFIGQSIDEIVAWFEENIKEPRVKGYDHFGFIVFNSDSLDKEVCTIVSFNVLEQDGDGLYQTVRCDFSIAITMTYCVSVGKSLRDTSACRFVNTSVIVSNERDMDLDEMEVEDDEVRREFTRLCQSRGSANH